MCISQLTLMNYSGSISLEAHFQALLDVIFEWFGWIVPEIGFN
jgi:hypothetical protein